MLNLCKASDECINLFSEEIIVLCRSFAKENKIDNIVMCYPAYGVPEFIFLPEECDINCVEELSNKIMQSHAVDTLPKEIENISFEVSCCPESEISNLKCCNLVIRNDTLYKLQRG